MQPTGIMMIEHRLIERMLGIMRRQSVLVRDMRTCDGSGVGELIDFVRVYIDRSHHGKEEELLFKPLLDKNVPQELKRLTGELIAEHARARELLAVLEGASARLRRGEKEAHRETAAERKKRTERPPRRSKRFPHSMRHTSKRKTGTSFSRP